VAAALRHRERIIVLEVEFITGVSRAELDEQVLGLLEDRIGADGVPRFLYLSPTSPIVGRRATVACLFPSPQPGNAHPRGSDLEPSAQKPDHMAAPEGFGNVLTIDCFVEFRSTARPIFREDESRKSCHDLICGKIRGNQASMFVPPPWHVRVPKEQEVRTRVTLGN
jgi:hypothetical protein